MPAPDLPTEESLQEAIAWPGGRLPRTGLAISPLEALVHCSSCSRALSNFRAFAPVKFQHWLPRLERPVWVILQCANSRQASELAGCWMQPLRLQLSGSRSRAGWQFASLAFMHTILHNVSDVAQLEVGNP